VGHLQIVRDFPSEPEGHPRTVRIYTPDAYDREPDRRFPVAYLQDGQNVFAHPDSWRWDTWCANHAIERTAAAGRTEPWILVAVDHGLDRFEEYSPWPEPRLAIQGRGEAYVRFLEGPLKRWVDARYRTRTGAQDTAILGSSLGGLIALYAGLTRPHVYGRIGGLSPTVMWCLGRMFEAWNAHPRSWTKVWLDVGGHERIWQREVELDYVTAVPAFHERLKGLGYHDWELRYFLDPDAAHDEGAWQRRLPEVFGWLLAP
jgi:predicted alpha/beta superfamily hydrolase